MYQTSFIEEAAGVTVRSAARNIPLWNKYTNLPPYVERTFLPLIETRGWA